MTEETTEQRLTVIEGKIDKLTELVSQTQLQEYRLSVVEQKVEKAQEKIIDIDKRAGNTALKWLGIIASSIITILLTFIAVKVGLK